jgi:hypothetical protein
MNETNRRPVTYGERQVQNDLTFRFEGGESNQGCRHRPKTKCAIGTTLAGLTHATTAADTGFQPGSGWPGRA